MTVRLVFIMISFVLSLSLINSSYAHLSPQHIQELKEKANKGNPHAQLKLGNYALVNNHYHKAHHWFKKLSQNKNKKQRAKGFSSLGLLYMLDQGPYSKNYKKSRDYYKKAIRLGDDGVYGNLGGIYYDGGHGIKQDRAKAKHYYQLAARKGDPYAQFNLGSLYANQNQYNKAFHWYHQAAKQYDLRGMLQTGLAYSLGKGVSKNKAQACKWLRLTLKVYPDYETGQEMLTSVENELGYLQQRACDKAYHKYLKHHDVPRKSDFKARLELKS